MTCRIISISNSEKIVSVKLKVNIYDIMTLQENNDEQCDLKCNFI